MQKESSNIVPGNFYKPSELLNIFRNFLSNKEINAVVLCLHGIYWKSDKIYGSVAFDQLKDENSVEEITIVVPLSLRENLKNGNLISVYGTVDRKLLAKGSIQILLNVTRIDLIKELAISEDEVKRAEFRRLKSERGYKNVDSILENKLFKGERPIIALIYAETSITNADFEKGLVAAKSYIDFQVYRVSFAKAVDIRTLLQQLDQKKYDAIALVRGGGSGIEKLDDVLIVETLANLQTAWIYGVGHEKENLFIRNIADKVIPIPFALGTYFRDLVEAVIQKRNSSRAVLVQEVKKQYEKQIEDSNKRNKELKDQLEVFQKQSKEHSAILNKQISEQTKVLEKIQAQQKLQQENFNRNLSKLQDENAKYQRDLNNEKSKVKDLEEQLSRANGGCAMPGCLGVAVIIFFIYLVIL